MNTERNVLVVRKELYLQKLTKLCQNEGWEVYQSTPSILIINAANHSADIHIKYWGAGFWGSVQKGKSLSLTVTPFDYQRSKMFRESKARNGEVDFEAIINFLRRSLDRAYAYQRHYQEKEVILQAARNAIYESGILEIRDVGPTVVKGQKPGFTVRFLDLPIEALADFKELLVKSENKQ